MMKSSNSALRQPMAGEALEALVARFLEERSAIWSPQTIDKYGAHLRSAADWLAAGGIARPDQVDPEALRGWLASHPQWGASYRHVAVSALRAFFAWSVGVMRSPAHRIPLPKRIIRPQRTLSAGQVEQLLGSIDTGRPKGARDLAIVALLLDTGLRSSEICRLELEHVDLEAQSFVVLAKGRRWERGVFGRYTRTLVERWIQLRPRFAREDERTVFVSVGGLTPGRQLTRYGLQIILRKLGQEAGIGVISPHDFRRTFATLAIRSGAPTRLVQLAGRWKSLAMVERYTQAVRPEDFGDYFPVNAVMGVPEAERP